MNQYYDVWDYGSAAFIMRAQLSWIAQVFKLHPDATTRVIRAGEEQVELHSTRFDYHIIIKRIDWVPGD